MSDDGLREVHVERLLGRRVRDARGATVGRIEEFCVEDVDGRPAVVEIHVGPGALFERVGAFLHQLPFLARLSWSPRIRRVRWDEIDLSDEWNPRLKDRHG